ncbi:MAG: hypothetical protein LBM92_05775 [Opitutaceae bacterium]|nr:hypothetical protein [Opitutaceae bacterium]
MTNADVIKMTADGPDESIIVNSIEHAAEAGFDVSSGGAKRAGCRLPQCRTGIFACPVWLSRLALSFGCPVRFWVFVHLASF